MPSPFSWLTSSSLSRFCRSCPRSSTVVVGAHRRQEAVAPPSSTASPLPYAVSEHPSYRHCPAAHTYYHGGHREEVALIRSSVSRYVPRHHRRAGRGDRVPACVKRAAPTPHGPNRPVGWASSTGSLGRSRPSTVHSIYLFSILFTFLEINTNFKNA
jgi:hypothetical protein